MDVLLPLNLAGLPTWVAIAITVAVPLALALLVGRVAQALFTPQEFAANAAVGGIKYGFVVEVYAVVAALTLVGAWETYQSSRDTLQKEAGSLYMLALSVDTFNGAEFADTRRDLRAAIRGYAASVVSDDWPEMQHGTPSGRSDAAFQRLTRRFLDLNGETPGQQALQQKLGDWLGQVAEARIARLSVTSRTLSALIWGLVLAVSVAVIAFQWFFGGASAALHVVMGGVIAVIVGAVLLVAVKLAFPYAGDAALLTPRPFLALMDVQ